MLMAFFRTNEQGSTNWARSLAPAIVVLVSALAFTDVEVRAEWPERAITIIVPFATGGHTDLLGRLLARELAPRLGQKVVVENRPSGNSKFDLSPGGHAAPNGYTLVVTSNAALIHLSMSSLSYSP